MRTRIQTIAVLCGLFGAPLLLSTPVLADSTGDVLARGRTLAASCVSCHTADGGLPFAGGRVVSTAYGPILSPNITQDPVSGIGRWSRVELAAYLKTGHNAHATATEPMARIVAGKTSTLGSADQDALVDYLVRLPPAANSVQAHPQEWTITPTALAAGQAIYRDVCAACHGAAGAGVPGLFPALDASAVVRAPSPAALLGVILHGAQQVSIASAPTAPAMPSFGRKLDDTEIAALADFLRREWGNGAPQVTADTVAEARRSLPVRTE